MLHSEINNIKFILRDLNLTYHTEGYAKQKYVISSTGILKFSWFMEN